MTLLEWSVTKKRHRSRIKCAHICSNSNFYLLRRFATSATSVASVCVIVTTHKSRLSTVNYTISFKNHLSFLYFFLYHYSSLSILSILSYSDLYSSLSSPLFSSLSPLLSSTSQQIEEFGKNERNTRRGRGRK